MNRIDARFAALKAEGKTAFIPYITAGDPNLAQTEKLVYALEKAGVDIIEFGVPFSDPVGDGPVNQEAALRALKNHITLKDIFACVARIRTNSPIPIVLFTYFNPVLAYGFVGFARDAAAAGVDGVLCVDLPPEEATEYKAALDEAGVRTVFLMAPTSTDKRIELIARNSTGFIYYVSRLGVTGERDALETDLRSAVARIKQHTDKPVAVGFGISTPAHARDVASMADGVVVGSAIVRMIGQLGDTPDMPEKVAAFTKTLVDAAKVI
ncbi:MAG: tryptophan synthase subunit alpha [Candidatus Hydrogenedentes bacterium]|nr:tryptophan synthase subunit alpha [Candidatus Hydrogenedentota bacterium]